MVEHWMRLQNYLGFVIELCDVCDEIDWKVLIIALFYERQGGQAKIPGRYDGRVGGCEKYSSTVAKSR